MRDGEGRMDYANGDEYRGGWAKDQKSGRGEMLAKGKYNYNGEVRPDAPWCMANGWWMWCPTHCNAHACLAGCSSFVASGTAPASAST